MFGYVGLLMMLGGLVTASSGKDSGVSLLMAGLLIFSYGLGGAVGVGIAGAVSLPFIAYSLAGVAGPAVCALLLILACVYASKRGKTDLAKNGFAFIRVGATKQRRQPGNALTGRLEALYPFATRQRGRDESLHDFAVREGKDAFYRGHNEFELEVADCAIVTPAGHRFQAVVHRVVLYQKGGRHHATTKQVVETKIA